HENEERTTKNSNSVTKPSTESDQAYNRLVPAKGGSSLTISFLEPADYFVARACAAPIVDDASVGFDPGM
ncbi:MAG: hypothetical protein K2Y23_27165, partial [Cyanobacteria bacterium]|nr:hypothetical protein [Cyanobacteriota bacterium]